MPTYTYLCETCGQFDWIHSMTKELHCCPKCGLPNFHKIFTNVGISFKGSGFYSTDNKGK